MKTKFTLLAFFTVHFSLFTVNCFAQVLCIKCYNQNARVLTDTNNLILNGGFENTTCSSIWPHDSSFCPNSNSYNCDIANWKCTGGGTGTYAHICDSTFSTIVEGTKAAYMGNYNANTCAFLSCLINLQCEVTGIAGYIMSDLNYGDILGVSLQQTVTGLTVGAKYELEFWAGGESDSGKFSKAGLFAVDIGFGNTYLWCPVTPPLNGVGTRYVIAFTATASSHTIKFTNWGHIIDTTNITEIILDDVRLFASTEGSSICSTAINELVKNSGATVFPNPATNRLTITTTSTQPSEVILEDIASRELMREKFSATATLSIENLAKGVYLYAVRDENGLLKQGKLVKE